MTADHIIVHDIRLAGQVFPHPELCIIEIGCEPIETVASFINAAVLITSPGAGIFLPHRPFSVLSIFAHGIDMRNDPMDWAMQVGHDYIHKNNAYAFGRSIRGSVFKDLAGRPCGRIILERLRAICAPHGGYLDRLKGFVRLTPRLRRVAG